jgi:uncharacterized protein (TIGR02118 family)
MIKLVYLLRRKPGMSREEFRHYWEHVHGPGVPAAADLLHFRRYVQVHTIETPVDDIWRIGRSKDEPFDGVAECWWDDLETLQQAMVTDEGKLGLFATLEDEVNFIDTERSIIFMAEEVEFPIPQSPDGDSAAAEG